MRPLSDSEREPLPAIRSVLAAYRSTAACITEEQITAAWAEFDALRVEVAQCHDAQLVAMYRRVKCAPHEGTAAAAIRVHAQACGFVAYALNVHPDTVAGAVADDPAEGQAGVKP